MGGVDRIGKAIMFEHGEEIPRLSSLDPLHLNHNEDRLVGEHLILQAERIERTEAMALMDGTMTDGMVLVMRGEMTGGHKQALGRRRLEIRKPNDSGNWLLCNKMLLS